MNLLNAHQFWGSIVRSRVLVDEFCYYLAGGEKKMGEFASTYHNKEPILDSDLYGDGHLEYFEPFVCMF